MKNLLVRMGAGLMALALSVTPLAYTSANGYYDGCDGWVELPAATPSYDWNTPPPTEDDWYVQDGFDLYVNKYHSGAQTYYRGDTLMLPLRPVIQSLGWSYAYNSGVISFGPSNKLQTLEIGVNAYKIGSKIYKLDYAPELTDGIAYVPWQFIEQGLKCKVSIKANGDAYVTTSKDSGSSGDTNSSTLRLYVNGKKLKGAPYYSGKTLMLPLRAVTTALGYNYHSDDILRAAIFEAKGIYCTIHWDENRYPIDNVYQELERAPQIKDGVLYVPASFMSEGLKCNVRVSSSKVKITR